MITSTTESGSAPPVAGPHGRADGHHAGGSAHGPRVALRVDALAFLGYLLLQTVQLLVLRRLAPRFFWLDDSQSQFGPMTWWMGRHLVNGRPPLMDPEQGMSGNLTADMQYGALDPMHWGMQALAARTDNVLTIAWIFGAFCVLLLGSGIFVLLRHYGVRPVLAVVGALGVASSGFFLWYGSSWWPLLWSVAWLPWFWWGLAARRWWSVAVLAVATWALLDSGNPYVLFFALALVVAQVVELVRGSGTFRVLIAPLALGRLAALTAGLAAALPTLLTAVQLSSVVLRQKPDLLIGNAGFGVANLVDVVLGGPTLMGETNGFGGIIQFVPAMATLLIAVPAVAFVDWPRAWRAPGVLSATAVYLMALVFTQLPTTVSVFRYPFRYIVVAEVALPVLVLVALSAAAVVTRRRIVVAGVLVLLQAALSWSRSPLFVRWHVLAAVVVAVALAGTVLLLRAPRRPTGKLGAALLVAATFGTLFVGEGLMVSVQHHVESLAGRPSPVDEPFRTLPAGDALGTTVAAYRGRSVGTDEAVTVITYGDFGDDKGWEAGVLAGNGNLLAGLRTGSGSLAVWQDALDQHWCRDYAGATCSPPETLLAAAPGTGTSWLDLLADDTVFLNKDAPEALKRHFDGTWAAKGQVRNYLEYTRRNVLPGRVTSAQGVTLSQAPGGSRLAYGDAPMDTYTVTTGAGGGTLTFRIPYWPGLKAALGGRPLAAGAVDGSVLQVTLPADVSAQTLTISYQPVGERILLPALGAALILALVAVGLAVFSRRRETITAVSTSEASGRSQDEAERVG